MNAHNAKKKVILVTDGDLIAQQAVEEATKKIGGRCISASAGNPTRLTGAEVVELIQSTPYDPVVVMVDDRGSTRKGNGERVLEYVAKHQDLELIGVLAVASNTENTDGAVVNCAITREQKVLSGEVDKEGELISPHALVRGDTVGVLNELGAEVPFVVGIGDLGKMEGRDNPQSGAQVTTKALQLILENWQKRQAFH